MNDGLFHFKRFSVAHSRSSMKVGVDGVLLGAWADCQGDYLLDVGTGCGVIALMLAQRNPAARILAIDVDSPSVEEAAENFLHSHWAERLESRLAPFSGIACSDELRFDRIVSNPPYFDSGVKDFTTARNIARHQGELSPSILVRYAGGILKSSGKLAMVVPSEFCDSLVEQGNNVGLPVSRLCFVKGNPRKPPKRVMMEFSKSFVGETESDTLTMFDNFNDPTEEYLALCHDFYLKF